MTIYQYADSIANLNTRLDATFLPWSIKLREQLLELFPLESGIHPIPDDVLLEPRWTLALVEPVNTNGHISTANGGSSEAIRNGSSNLKGNSSPDELLDVLLVENRRTTSSNHWQDVRHLVLESQHQASYAPGDTITIYPMNAEGDVEHLLSLMDWTGVADEPINFVPAARTRATDMVPPLPIANIRPRSHLTLRKLLMKHLDITAIPRRSFFAFVAHFASNPMQKERLLEFTNPEYVDELYDYTTRPRRSILEVIQEFDSIKIPWQWATSVLPELRGRQFSIASGGQLKKGESNITRFELSVAIVKYKTVIKKIREGVCTRYLARIPTGSHMQVTLQKGGLSITKAEARLPVVMIGPGTGVAPMRSLIWERLEWAEELHNGQNKTDHGSTNTTVNIGESVLFFGCRNREKDFLYEDEWEGLEKKMNLKVFTAFSRDQKRKVYVQDRIREQSDLVFRLLHECGGVVYICGSSGKMPQAVREALIEVFQGGTRMEREDAEAYLIQMEKEGRYKQETW